MTTVQNPLLSRLLSKSQKIKMYKIVTSLHVFVLMELDLLPERENII
jgi:hypothetical protein